MPWWKALEKDGWATFRSTATLKIFSCPEDGLEYYSNRNCLSENPSVKSGFYAVVVMLDLTKPPNTRLFSFQEISMPINTYLYKP